MDLSGNKLLDVIISRGFEGYKTFLTDVVSKVLQAHPLEPCNSQHGMAVIHCLRNIFGKGRDRALHVSVNEIFGQATIEMAKLLHSGVSIRWVGNPFMVPIEFMPTGEDQFLTRIVLRHIESGLFVIIEIFFSMRD